jgi:hypothetical protein
MHGSSNSLFRGLGAELAVNATHSVKGVARKKFNRFIAACG